MGSIHVQGVSTMETISAGVQNLLKDIQAKAARVGQPGGMSPQEFAAYQLDMDTRLSIMRQLAAVTG